MSEDSICKRVPAKTICQDLLISIFKMLPIKTLLRIRCVCKSWKEIIASKCFVLDHLAIQTPRLIAQNHRAKYLLLDSRTLPWCDSLTCPVEFVSLFSPQLCVVVGGVHGVMCLYNNDDRFFLWNPSTRQSLRIPLRVGLWLCPLSCENRLQVLWICPRAALFSSRKPGVWNEVDASGIIPGSITCVSTQVLMGEVAYWIAYAPTEDSKARVMLFFDFDKDKFGMIELPESVRHSQPRCRCVNACKWHGSLSFVHWQFTSPYECDLWVMQNETWSKMLSFNLIRGIGEVHCVLEDCGRLIVSEHDFFSKKMSCYDPKDRCMTPLESEFLDCGMPIVARDFVESLVFPDPKCISRDESCYVQVL